MAHAVLYYNVNSIHCLVYYLNGNNMPYDVNVLSFVHILYTCRQISANNIMGTFEGWHNLYIFVFSYPQNIPHTYMIYIYYRYTHNIYI